MILTDFERKTRVENAYFIAIAIAITTATVWNSNSGKHSTIWIFKPLPASSQ